MSKMAPMTQRSLLHVAVVEEKIGVVSDLINGKAEINATDSQKLTPLHLALETRNLSIIKLLLDAGADVHAKNGAMSENFILEPNTPLRLAIKSNNPSIIKCFIDAISDVDAKDEEENTMLHLAAKWGNSNTVKLLLDAGFDVHAENSSQMTALAEACVTTNNPDSVKLLIEAGSNVNTNDRYYNTPLHYATRSENLSIIKLLIEAGADVNAKDDEDNTPLHAVATCGTSDVFKLLVDAGADVDALDEWKDTPLLQALKNKNMNILNTIIDSGANVNAVNFFGNAALHFAVPFKDLELLRSFVKAGADMNIKDFERHMSPMHYAEQMKDFEILQLLLRAGGNVNDQDINGHTSLSYFSLAFLTKHGDIDKKLTKSFKLLLECTHVNLSFKNGRNIVSSILKSSDFPLVGEFFYYEIILQQIAILRTLNLPLNVELMDTISQKNNYEDFFTECLQELEKAKSTRIEDCWVPFFNLLVDEKSKLVEYAGNEDLIKGFVKRADDFPIYGKWMLSKLSEGIRGSEIYDRAADSLSSNLPIFDSFHSVIRDILDTLTEQDRNQLCDFVVNVKRRRK